MPNIATLWQEFNEVLLDVWETWHIHDGERAGPFMELKSVGELYQSPGYSYSVGWALGVSEAMGWSTEDPGPKSKKDWDPRD